VEPSAVVLIVVRSGDGKQSVTLTRVPGDWRLTDVKGSRSAPDLAQISRVIQILGTLRYNRVIRDQNVAAYGLSGDGKVTIEFDAGISHRLKIGDLAQVSGFTFVQRDGDAAVYLVPTETIGVVSGLLAGSDPSP
jgi:hypothetical protein